MQPPKTRHTRTAKRVSTAPSPNTVSNIEGVNASMVRDIASYPQQEDYLHYDQTVGTFTSTSIVESEAGRDT